MRKLTVAAAAIAAALALAACAAPGTGTPSGASATAPASKAAAATAPAAGTPAPRAVSGGAGQPGFSALSMTFVSDQQGWALGTVACGTGRCLSLLGTTDGGAVWRVLTAPARTAGGAYGTCPNGAPCVQQVRFATPLIGYAFGPDLFTTADGGRTWTRQSGVDTTSLEAAGGTVVRVMSGLHGCAGQPYAVQLSPLGPPAWTALLAPPIYMICPPVLYRQGSRLVLVSYGNPAGGVRATAVIERSADGGRTWTKGLDSCGGTHGYASGVALAPPDVLVLLCQNQGATAGAWVRVSVNGGASFGPDQAVPMVLSAPIQSVLSFQLAAASAGRLLVVETLSGEHVASRVLLSQDGGQHWQDTLALPARAQSQPPPLLVGYEDPLTGRVAQGNVVWTTRNGGQSWTADRF